MTFLNWTLDAEARGRAYAIRDAEKARAAVARDQARALRRQRRRNQRIRVMQWCGRHKMVSYPVGFVACMTIGMFTWSTLAGWMTLGVGILIIEWRVAK